MTRDPSTPIFSVNSLSKRYGSTTVVNDLSFSIAPGECLGVIGPNGAGKTTTIRMMMDIIEPDSGEVTILGKKLGEAAKNRLGYLPEERGLYKQQRVIDSIVYLASLKGMDKRVAEAKADELLAQTGM
ncbi:MAG: ATP-binding cassette domain-containing protein, partial [Polaromonas sp.]|nr:ATP-binding cassette domain-containing protein [Polaromonas sp.]